MNDHNLDDLIIGEPGPGGGKSKSLLSLIALALIILIVGVLLAKLIFGGSEETGKEETTELSGIVTPEKRAPDLPQAKPAEKVPDELKPISHETMPESDELKPLAPLTPPKAQPKPKPKPQARPKPKPLPKPKPKPKPVSRKPATKPKPAELFKKREAAASAQTGTAMKSYYIQLGSFKRMPDQKFLDKIKAAGYKPVIVKSGEMIKVRIGTYPSYGDAKAKLPQIKEQLGIDGFVVRKK